MPEATARSGGRPSTRAPSTTMAFTYELRRMSRLPEMVHTDLFYVDLPFALFENQPTSSLPAVEETTVFSATPKRKTITAAVANRLTVAMGATQPIRVNLSLYQLLQVDSGSIPNDTSGIELKLTEPSELLELIVDPAPNTTDNNAVFNFLGGDGAKQPAIIFGTVGYVIDYLVSPHTGTQQQRAKFTMMKQAAKQPSMMNLMSDLVADVNNTAAAMDDDQMASLSRTVVRDSLPLWVRHLWDSFLLTLKEGISVQEFCREIILRVEKTTEIQVGGGGDLQQSAFETNDGHLVVASRRPRENAENSSMNRSARAVLMWMGIYQNHRNAQAIKQNALLLLLHWLKSSSGPLDLCSEDRTAFDLLESAMTLTNEQETNEISLLKRLISRELCIIRDVCGFSVNKVQRCFGLDFNGVLCSQQNEDLDQFRMRELVLCTHAYTSGEHALPKWARQMPIYTQPPDVVAGLITLLTYDLVYRHVNRLMLVTDKQRQTSRPVQDMIRLFKVFSYWPLTCLFEEGIKLAEALDRLLFFLSVAEHLRRLANYHVLFAVVGGLTQPYVAWLWAALPATHKAHKRFEDLKRVISSNGDYRVYKADLSHCQGKSRIPFLGVTARMLVQLEAESALCGVHPHLYHFSRQVARSAVINDFVGGQRHPYLAVNGTTFSIYSGPPGPSPYVLMGDGCGTITGSKYAQYPPSAVSQGVYSTAGLGTGLEDTHPVRIASATVEDKRTYSGCVEIVDNMDLKLAVSWSISMTQEESALKEISKEAQRNLIPSADH